MSTKRTFFWSGAILGTLIVLCLVFLSRFWPSKLGTQAAADKELAKFQGTWEFVSMEADGQKKPDEHFKKYVVVLTNGYWNVYEGTRTVAETPFQVDPTANPKTIDLFPSDGRILQGIYRFEDDRLTMCDRGTENGERPAEYATKPDSGLVLVVLKRVNR